MVPRYMVPPWLHGYRLLISAGKAANARTIDASHRVLQPEPGWHLAAAIVGMTLALLVSKSRLRSWDMQGDDIDDR